MFFRILKKDLKRKRTMNLILFLFIIMATAFLTSSLTNLTVTSTAVDHFLKISHAGDMTLFVYATGGEDANVDQLTQWLDTNEDVKSYTSESGIVMTKNNLQHDGGEYKIEQSIFVQQVPKEASMVFDEQGEAVTLNDGEIAVPVYEAKINQIEVGDTISITLGGQTKEFKVATIMKDSVFGSALMGFKRFVVNENDYQQLEQNYTGRQDYCYNIFTDNLEQLEKSYKQQKLEVGVQFTIDTVKTAYSMDMLIAAILMIVSICLILISFLILRFTIVYTLQDDYKEIGIMKAIGLKNMGIRGIYLIKYFGMSVVGAVMGCFLGIPFSQLMLKEVSTDIIMQKAGASWQICLVGSVLVVIMIMGFCFLCTGKLKKISAIDAIRNGSNGERFARKNLIYLHKSRLSVVWYMAINDILSNLKRYVVLILTFIIGTLIIILPVNAINTLEDDSLVGQFGQIQSDFYIDTQDMDKYVAQGDIYNFRDDLHAIEQYYCDNGVEVNVYGENGFTFQVYTEREEDAEVVFGTQGIDSDAVRYQFMEGEVPVLENEVALTERTAEKIHASVGDTVWLTYMGTKYEMIVTGLYETMTNMGNGLRVANCFPTDMSKSAGMSAIQGDFIDRTDIPGQIEKLKELTPDYKIMNSGEMLTKYLGSVLDNLNDLKNLLVGIVLSINALITILMCKTFLVKEKGEIAMLRSIGFRYAAIRRWQVVRFSIILVISITAGVCLSHVLNACTVGPVFSMMGATQLKMTIIPLQVYCFYPLLIMTVTIIVCILTVRVACHAEISDMNNME